MNSVRIPRPLNRSLLLVPLLAASLILSACGGDGKNTSTSSSSSSSSAHSLIPTPVTPSGSGVWPSIKVSASGTKTLHFEWNSAPASTYYKLLKKADSSSTYQQVGGNIADPSASGAGSATDAVSVHLTDWVNSSYLVQACNDSGCVDSTPLATNSAMLTAITYIKASNADADDWFGWSIALSGDGQTLAVGAPAEDGTGVNQDQTSNDSPNSGAVYIFIKNSQGSWQQQAYLKASNTEQPNENTAASLANDRFGYQVALSPDGNTLAVSAINEDSPSRGINCSENDLEVPYSSASSTGIAHVSYNTGAVYLFKRSLSEWAQTTYVKPHNPMQNGLFGSSLSLSGDGKTLAVGSYLESTSGAGIYDARSFSSSCIDFSASSVSSSSSSVSSSSVSSNSSSLMGGQQSGAVYLFKETDTGWIEETFIKASDAGAEDHFGGSISLSHDGNTLAVGAPGEDSKDTGSIDDKVTVKGANFDRNNGGVYIFANADNAWTQKAKVKPYDNGLSQQFGFSVALSGDGNTLAVGAPGDWSRSSGVEAITAGVIGPLGANYNLEADVSSYATGAAYIFVKDAENWTATTYLKAANAGTGYQFGHHLAISKDGRTLAVGSVEEASAATGINGDSVDSSAKASGAAYIFTLNGTSWLQKSYVKAPDTTTNDRFANSLKLDDSGDILAVGAHRESSAATGINGDKTNNPLTPATGAVYLF